MKNVRNLLYNRLSIHVIENLLKDQLKNEYEEIVLPESVVTNAVKKAAKEMYQYEDNEAIMDASDKLVNQNRRRFMNKIVRLSNLYASMGLKSNITELVNDVNMSLDEVLTFLKNGMKLHTIKVLEEEFESWVDEVIEKYLKE